MFARFLICIALFGMLMSPTMSAVTFPTCGKVVDLKCGIKDIRSDRWMQDLKFQIGNVKMSKVKIPASHDSGTYAINDFKSYSIDISSDPTMALIPTLVNLFGAYGLNATNIKSFVAPWVKTQKCSFADQLTHGLRHFDLRVCYSGGVFTLCHALNANNVSDELAAIRAWSDKHPKEVISLDFNHLYGFSNAAAHQAFANLTLGALGSDNIASSLGFNNTYNDFIGAKKRFKLFYANSAYASLLLAEPSANLPTPWPNVVDMGLLKNATLNNLAARTDFSKGFVSQVELTPTLNMMINGIVSNLMSVEELSEQRYFVISDWFKNLSNELKDKVNIVNTDFYNAKFLREIILLNL